MTNMPVFLEIRFHPLPIVNLFSMTLFVYGTIITIILLEIAQELSDEVDIRHAVYAENTLRISQASMV